MPRTTLWPLEPHTEAKHRLLQRYLGAWFPILSRSSGRIVFFDGFAGPGEFEGGEPGSPILALQTLLDHQIPGTDDTVRVPLNILRGGRPSL